MSEGAPRRPLSFGLRLGCSTALIVTIVMGAVSVWQQVSWMERERALRKESIEASVAPLLVRLEKVVSVEEMRGELVQFHVAYLINGKAAHSLTVLDAQGDLAMEVPDNPLVEPGTDYERYSFPVRSPLLEGKQGTLIVTDSIPDRTEVVRRDAWMWLAHFAATAASVTLFLGLSLYLQVTRPINRLVDGVRKMELGYWSQIKPVGGAWEIRWLATRFTNMVQEVRYSLTHLIEAETIARSLALGDDTLSKSLWQASDEQSVPDSESEASDPKALTAIDASNPNAVAAIDERLDTLKSVWASWADRQRKLINDVLERHGIPCVKLLFRLKHTISVWRKMRDKGLEFDEIQDVFAFRIIVPTQADCYAALGAIHSVCVPEIGRFKDYIRRPKENGYRALHTTVRAKDGPAFEVQIRSIAMEEQAELGDAAHRLYKAGDA